MNPSSRLHFWAVAVLALAVGVVLSAQTAGTAEQTRAKLEIGAGFLKSGDIELATKTFTQVLDADATNWQARALLAVAYLGSRDLDKADTELRRLKTQNAPAATLAALDRQVTAARTTMELRDKLSKLLEAGKWQEALTSIDVIGLPDGRKQLLKAYVAALRGEFDEARRLTSDPQFASFNASITKRADEFQVAREKALVALNFLGARYCGQYDQMRHCADQPPLTRNEQAAWDEIRSGNGKVSSQLMADKPKTPGSVGAYMAYFADVMEATQMRANAALLLINQFVSMAPLHPEALQSNVVLSLYSGSSAAVRAAADRSLNGSGVWALSTRTCRKHTCQVGDDKVDKDLPVEGLVELDGRSRMLRYSAVPAKAWLTDMRPPTGRLAFEVPLQQVAVIKSSPDVRISSFSQGLMPNGTLFDFGSKRTVQMLLDFTFPVAGSSSRDPLLAVKAIEDVVNTMGQLIPSAKVDYRRGTSAPGGLAQLFAGAALAGVGAATGNAVAEQQGQQLAQQWGQQQTDSAHAQAQAWRAMSDLKSQDGKSIVDSAFEDEGLKKDLNSLLTLTLQ